MSQIVEIPGQGEVEFPDSMSDADISAAAKRLSAPPPAPQVGAGTAFLRGGAQGATMGFGDEAQGAIQALGGRVLPQSMGGFGPEHHASFAADYRQNRDTNRAENEAARKSQPTAYTAGDVGGSVLSSFLGGAATGTLKATAGRRLLAALAGQGMVQGAGFSDANTARGLAGDTALGGGAGVAGYGAGQAIGALGRKVSGALAGVGAKAAARAATQAGEEESAKVATLASRYGGEVQKGSRQVENLMRLEPVVPPGQQSQIAALEQGGIIPALQQQVAGSTINALPAQAGTIAAREAELRAAQTALPQAVADRTAQLQTSQFGKDAASFFKSYGEPLVWGGLGAGAGHMLGLSPSETAMLGAVTGSLGGRTRAGKALLSRLARPGNQMALARFGQGVATTSGDVLRQLLQRAAPVAATQSLVEP